MINIEEEYFGLMSGILYGGTHKGDRTGVGTKSVFGRIIRHDMSLGYPLLTTKKVFFNFALTEVLWILQGRTDIKYLNDHKVTYWNPNYEASGRTDGDLGPVYGKQLRDFNGEDQLEAILNQIKLNPQSRRILVNYWNPAELGLMVLPPCHYGFQVYINDGKMDLMWQQRSVDVFLGLPYDIAMYGLLLLMLAKGSGYEPGQLIGQLGDCHLYTTHLDAAKEQLSRSGGILPTVELTKGLSITKKIVDIPTHEDVKLIGYNPQSIIKAPIAV